MSNLWFRNTDGNLQNITKVFKEGHSFHEKYKFKVQGPNGYEITLKQNLSKEQVENVLKEFERLIISNKPYIINEVN